MHARSVLGLCTWFRIHSRCWYSGSKHVSLPVQCPTPLSVCPNGFSTISDGLVDYLTGFYDTIDA